MEFHGILFAAPLYMEVFLFHIMFYEPNFDIIHDWMLLTIINDILCLTISIKIGKYSCYLLILLNSQKYCTLDQTAWISLVFSILWIWQNDSK
jgi:hypothetical protein